MTESGTEKDASQNSWLDRFTRWLLVEPRDKDELLEVLQDAHQRKLFDSEALSMLNGVFRVSEMRVRDIMIPRVQVVTIPHDAEMDKIISIVVESGHSRFPVTGDDPGEVVGVLLAKDLLAHVLKKQPVSLDKIMRQARFVPESKRLNILLREFRSHRNHMVMVVDEYGTAAGMVTIEDVLEQIVGKIEDEHDLDLEDFILRISDRKFTIKALTPIEEFNQYFTADFNTDDFDTVGGLISHQLGYVPKHGETITMNEFVFEVLHADKRRVHLFRLNLTQPDAQHDAAQS
ncbi:MAG: CBS domain-containing protein [Gammaproteobacteria bacterium]|nr:CBS domain-containing protein [Gammaproteobacteria bacterium]